MTSTFTFSTPAAANASWQDGAASSLRLHFAPVAEMRPGVRPAGVVAAWVWENAGGMPAMRIMIDTVARQSEVWKTWLLFMSTTTCRPLTTAAP